LADVKQIPVFVSSHGLFEAPRHRGAFFAPIAEVRREMQLAINAANEKPNAAALVVPRKGAIPTPEEFIKYTASVVNTQV